MAEEAKRTNWEDVREEFRLVYILTIFFLLLGITIDLLKKDTRNNSLSVDLPTIGIWITVLLLMLFRLCRLTLCFAIAAYTLVINIFLTFIINSHGADVILHFYRDSILISCILTFTAYFVNKNHAFIIAGIYILFILLIRLFYDTLGFENSYTLMFCMGAYSVLIFFFVKKQESTLEDLNQTNHKVYQQNEELMQQQEEITTQRDALAKQKKLIENRNAAILDSIHLAKSIQESVLSREEYIRKFFRQFFVINRPKAVISGDFFWVKELKDKIFIAVVDCTGHGVPGALVSMLVNMYLGRAFIEVDNPNPASILNYINESITKEMNLDEQFHSRIGMDIALISVSMDFSSLEYSGAFIPLYLIRRDNLIECEAPKVMIGSIFGKEKFDFKSQTLELRKGDRMYLFSDGAVDQFGGRLDKKLGYKKFRNALVDTNHGSMETQKSLLYNKWLKWKGDNPQVDDLLIIGLEI
jgi:serine phosphatase RsbU (regulator of sigma subunit)